MTECREREREREEWGRRRGEIHRSRCHQAETTAPPPSSVNRSVTLSCQGLPVPINLRLFLEWSKFKGRYSRGGKQRGEANDRKIKKFARTIILPSVNFSSFSLLKWMFKSSDLSLIKVKVVKRAIFLSIALLNLRVNLLFEIIKKVSNYRRGIFSIKKNPSL